MSVTTGGGILFFPRTGGCFIATNLLVGAGTTILGAGQQASCISTGGTDTLALQFIGIYGAMRDIQVLCSQSAAATGGCVYVDDNIKADMANIIIFGGYRALINHGVDGRYYNMYISAAATTVGSANVFSRGANWYIDCKFDSIVAVDFGFYIFAPYTSSTSQMENHIHNTDFSGPWGSAGLAIDDSANPAAVPTAVTWISGGIIGQGGVANVIINQAVWSVFTGTAARFYTHGASGGTLTIGNSWGGTSAGGTVTGAGTDRLCSNNKNLTC